jgi:putative transposase
MPQSLANVLIHLVFSTKERRPFLKTKEDQDAMYTLLRNTSANIDCPLLIAGGIADHVHLLGRLSRTVSIADWVKELKRVSSAEIKAQRPHLVTFSWQSGYGAFSVSQSQVDVLANYIATQEEHHKTRDFQAEFRLLCRKHNIEIDECYVWD